MSEPNETREERFSRQTNECFAALGRFVQDFESMVDTARLLSATHFGQFQPYANFLLHHSSVSAKVLIDCARAILESRLKERDAIHALSEKEIMRGVLGQVQDEFEKLMKARNHLLHGTWYIGWGSSPDDDFTSFTVSKAAIGKDGYRSIDNLPTRASELDDLSLRCKTVSAYLWRIDACIGGHGTASKNFEKDVDSKRWKFTVAAAAASGLS